MKLLLIGEKINSCRKEIKEAIDRSEEKLIQKLAHEQAEAGADYIDANAGLFLDQEPEKLRWLVRVIQKAVDLPCCLDSANPAALEAALEVHRGKAMLNSISLENERYRSLLPLIMKYKTKLVALCLNDEGMPKNCANRFKVASELVERLKKDGVPDEDIYLDPLVQPIATNHLMGSVILDSIARFKASFQTSHVICGLSNISFGLPNRKMINQIFLVLALSKGLDAVVLDLTNPKMHSCIRAAQLLLAQDEYCSEYLLAFRQGRLNY